MVAIEVHPEVLSGSGQALSGEGDGLASAVGRLDGALSSGAAMCGHDKAGVVFGDSYMREGRALVSAAAAGVNACRKLGFGISMSAFNYSHAEAASTTGGGATALPRPAEPAKFWAPALPSPFGSGIAAPTLWFLVEQYVGDFWPDGKPQQCRAAASAWRNFGTALGGTATEVHAAGPAVGAHQIPEGATIKAATGQVSKDLNGLAAQCRATAGHLDSFAGQVESAQNAIRDLLHRLGPSGILGDLNPFHPQNPLHDILAIAHDIKAVLANMKREAEAAEAMFQAAMAELDAATTALENWDRKVFVHFLGDHIGNATADLVNSQLDISEGGLKSVFDTVHGLEQLDPTRFFYDPKGAAKTWMGAGQTLNELSNPLAMAAGVASDPKGHLEKAKALVDAKDWSSDHPLRGLGHNLGDLAQFAIPGGGEAKPGIAAAETEGRTAAASAKVDAGAPSGALRDGASAATRAGLDGDVAAQSGRIGNDLNNVKMPDATPPHVDTPGVHPDTSGVHPAQATPAPHVSDPPAGRVSDPPAPHNPPMAHANPASPPADAAQLAAHHPEPPPPPSPGFAHHTPVDAPQPSGLAHRVPPIDTSQLLGKHPDLTPPPGSGGMAHHAPPIDASQLVGKHSDLTPPPGSGGVADHTPVDASTAPPRLRSPDPGGPSGDHISPGDGPHDTGQPLHDSADSGTHDTEPTDWGNHVGPDGRIKISGHGEYYPADGTTVIPPGTHLTVYAEHGANITENLGQAIERGEDVSHVYSETFPPGAEIPNYKLLPIQDWEIAGTPYTVGEQSKLLSEILEPDMGSVDLAACLHDLNSPNSLTWYDIDAVREGGGEIRPYDVTANDPLYRLWKRLFRR